MESCVVVCNRRKPVARKGKVLFIDALNEVTTNADGTEPATLPAAWAQWQADGRAFWQQMDALVETLDGLDRA